MNATTIPDWCIATSSRTGLTVSSEHHISRATVEATTSFASQLSPFASKPAACWRPLINSALLLYLAGRVTPSGVDVRLKNASSDTVTRFITSKHLHIPLWHRNLEYIIFFIIGGDGHQRIQLRPNRLCWRPHVL